MIQVGGTLAVEVPSTLAIDDRGDVIDVVLVEDVDPGSLVDGLVAENPHTAGKRLAEAVPDLLDLDEVRTPMTGLIRVAASEPDAAVRARELLTERTFGPFVAVRYEGADQSLVRDCWILMLAMVTAWRFEPGDDLPGGRALASGWIRQLRAAVE